VEELRRAIRQWLEENWVVPDLEPGELEIVRVPPRPGEPNWLLKGAHDVGVPAAARVILGQVERWAQERYDLE